MTAKNSGKSFSSSAKPGKTTTKAGWSKSRGEVWQVSKASGSSIRRTKDPYNKRSESAPGDSKKGSTTSNNVD